jgi:hypothetical protein
MLITRTALEWFIVECIVTRTARKVKVAAESACSKVFDKVPKGCYDDAASNT